MSATFGGRASARNATDPSRPTSAITTMNPRGVTGGVNRGTTQLQPQTVNPGTNTTTTPPNWGSTGEYSTNPTLANGQPAPTPAATAPRPAATRPTGAGYGTPATTQNWINPAAGQQVQSPSPPAPPPATTPTTPPPATPPPTTGGPAVENTSPPNPNPTTTPPAQTFSTADYFRRALGLSGSGTGSAVLPPSATQNFTADQIFQGLSSVTTPITWEAPPEGMFTAPSTPDTNTLLRIGGPNGPSINPTQVQNIINNRGTGAAMETLLQDLASQSPAAQLANAVRQQQISQAALPQMFQDLRNVPQLYANPVTRALLPAEIRQAEEVRLNGGPDWRIASFGDAIDGNIVTRAVPTSDFRAPTGAAPTVTPAQRQQNLVADFVNSYLPYMNNPGSRGLSQQYNITELNSALAAEPAARQAMVANRLTGLTTQQLQVALQISGLTLPQFLSQAVARLAG